MEKNVLVIGKRVQLLESLQKQLVENFKKVQQITEKEQVEFMFNDRTAADMAKKRKENGATVVNLVGIKGVMIPHYIKTISGSASKEEELIFIVMCPEGPVLPMDTKYTVIIQDSIELKVEDFPKQQKAA
jgi:predicted alpha/beta-fold hydrolase